MNIRSSIRKLAALFIILFLTMSGGLIYWQVVVAQAVTANPHNGRPYLPNNAPQRGRIFDRNGVLLAYSQPLSSGGYIRHYTDPSLAALIGYYAGPNYASTGIEHQFDAYLSGRAGMTALNNTVNSLLHRPPVGDDIYLTIDERVQKLVNQHFDDPYAIEAGMTFRSNRGSVVVTDPHTGEILAMVSRPTFDPNRLVQTLANGDLSYYNQLASNPEQPLLERPLQAKYVPGSTFKTLTLLAALDSGKTTLDQEFNQKQALGPIAVGQHLVGPTGNNLEPYTFRFPVTSQYGFVHSDNVIYAQIGAETGVDTWLNYAKRFYVGQQIPFDLPVAVSTVTPPGQALTLNTLADDAFGQGSDFVTPLQMSLIDNVAANNGQLMRPMLVLKITSQDKTPIQVNQPQSLGQVVSTETATEVRQAMYGVVRCGSGLVAGVDLNTSPYSIIAKTGTGEIGGGKPAQSWLITAAPYSVTNPNQLPALTIVGMRENAGEGGNAVGPMITHMYNDIFTNVMKQSEPPAPNPNYCCQTQLLQEGCA